MPKRVHSKLPSYRRNDASALWLQERGVKSLGALVSQRRGALREHAREKRISGE